MHCPPAKEWGERLIVSCSKHWQPRPTVLRCQLLTLPSFERCTKNVDSQLPIQDFMKVGNMELFPLAKKVVASTL